MKKTIILLILSVILFSCGSDSDEDNPFIVGKWEYVNTRTTYFDKGEIKEETSVNENTKNNLFIFKSDGTGYWVILDKNGYEEEYSKQRFTWVLDNDKYVIDLVGYVVVFENNNLLVYTPLIAPEPGSQHYIKSRYILWKKTSSNYTAKKD